ncbi:MAG: hypothetical protein ABL959_00570 [Pyrinomonadaceae bacterium]
MKYLLNTIILTVALAAVSFGQTKVNSGAQLELKGSNPRIAVLEFTAQPNAVPANGTQALQNGIATAAKKEGHKDWIEIPSTSSHVRDTYKQLLGRPVDPATAVKIGKLLGVNYVMTGHVKVFNGITSIDVRAVNVASGAIIWAGPVRVAGDWNADGTISSGDFDRVAIQQLTASLKDANL